MKTDKENIGENAEDILSIVGTLETLMNRASKDVESFGDDNTDYKESSDAFKKFLTGLKALVTEIKNNH